MNQAKVAAILLMGGKGERFRGELPKQFHRLSGKKVYLHTLVRFLESNLFHEIILVAPQEWAREVESDIAAYGMSHIRIVTGGATRQDSSYLGLLSCTKETTHVVIHDAVRPFVSRRILEENVEGAIRYGAVDTCIPSADTLVYAPSSKAIEEIPNRSDYLRGQTPQSFSYSVILEAHEHARREKVAHVSDDCRLVLSHGHPVHVVKGDEQNIKITTELDLFLAEQLLRLGQSAPAAIGPERSLKGKCFAITGGSGGIGKALAELLRKEGAIPLIVSRSSDSYPADLTAPEQVEGIFKSIHDKHGPIDGLINCIGLFKLQKVAYLTAEEIQELINTNLSSVIYSCRAVELKEKGHIINVASSSYSRGRKEFAVYSSAKAAVVNFTQGLAEELPHLCINAVAPQRTSTPMRHAHFPGEDPSTLLSPETVAASILTLLKQQSLTGSILEVR